MFLVFTLDGIESKLLKTTKLNLTMDNVIPITVSPHYNLNTKKGVIRCPDIKDCSDEEILDGLKDEGVIKLDRILVNRKQETNRDIYIDLPKSDLAKIHQGGLLQGGVSQFIPNPILLSSCIRFIHLNRFVFMFCICFS